MTDFIGALGDLSTTLSAPPANAPPAAAAPPSAFDAALGDLGAAAQGKLPQQAAAPSHDELLPIAPYDATEAAMHGMTFGLSDDAAAAMLAAGRWLRGQGFDYPQAAREVQRGRDIYAGAHPLLNTAANLAGSMVTGAPIAKAIGAAAPLGQILSGAASGGAIGAVQGAADNNTSLANAATGAERGGTTGALLGGGLAMAGPLARFVAPGVSAPLQTLRAAGVEPTPGAALGGLPAAAENFVARLPIIGTPIQAGRAAAQGQLQHALASGADNFNREAVNQVLSPIGESLGAGTKTGNDAIAEMAQKAGDAYNKAVPNAGAPLDQQYAGEIANLRADLALRAPSKVAQFDAFRAGKIIAPTGQAGAVLPGQAFKDAESDLGGEARRLLSGNSSSDDRALADAYRGTQAALRDNLARNNPQSAAAITAANQAWRNMLPVQDAAASDLQSGGVFTPQQLAASARKFAGRTQFARGAAPMQDFAQNAMLQRGELLDAGKALAPGSAANHGAGLGAGIIGADLLERLMEHPSPALLGGAALAYPTLGAVYSNAGRGAINGLVSRSYSLPSPGLLAPFAAQQATSQRGPFGQ